MVPAINGPVGGTRIGWVVGTRCGIAGILFVLSGLVNLSNSNSVVLHEVVELLFDDVP